MSERMPLNWCPVCGKKLFDNFRATRLMHDRMYHPDYMLLQMGIPECEHENKTHNEEIFIEKELVPFHLEFCDECFRYIPKEFTNGGKDDVE